MDKEYEGRLVWNDETVASVTKEHFSASITQGKKKASTALDSKGGAFKARIRLCLFLLSTARSRHCYHCYESGLKGARIINKRECANMFNSAPQA